MHAKAGAYEAKISELKGSLAEVKAHRTNEISALTLKAAAIDGMEYRRQAADQSKAILERDKTIRELRSDLESFRSGSHDYLHSYFSALGAAVSTVVGIRGQEAKIAALLDEYKRRRDESGPENKRV